MTPDECDALYDWWDDETTASVQSAFPVIARIITARVDKVFRLTLDLAAARLDLTAADNEDGGVDMDAQVYRAAAAIVRSLAPPT